MRCFFGLVLHPRTTRDDGLYVVLIAMGLVIRFLRANATHLPLSLSPYFPIGYFQLPDLYNFPPFFTIQPVLITREKQLEQWRDLILKYRE
jgi:hypothetical protein